MKTNEEKSKDDWSGVSSQGEVGTKYALKIGHYIIREDIFVGDSVLDVKKGLRKRFPTIIILSIRYWGKDVHGKEYLVRYKIWKNKI